MKAKTVEKGVLLAAVCVLVLAWSGLTAKADELGDLRKELEAQKKKTAELEERLIQMEARQRLDQKKTDEKIQQVVAEAEEKSKEAPGTVPDVLKWAANAKWSGDFRYRHEYIDDKSQKAGKTLRNRDRIRARVGLDAKVNDEWDFGFRGASGSADPVSTNQTLDESFSRKPFWLDLAYLTWHPEFVKGLSVTAGKVKNPFYQVGKNQLIWDGDLTPEGGALHYTVPVSGKTSLNLAGGGFWVNEHSGGVDTSLFGLQAYVKHAIGNPWTIIGGASFFDYGNIQGMTSLYNEWAMDGTHKLFGNVPVAGDPNSYASDFDLVELFVELAGKIGGVPVSVHGDWVKNQGAVNDQDTGWLVGGTINKAKDPGSWEASYDYRDIERDAVVGQFNDSDFIGGGTGGEGHRFGFLYQIAKNVQLGLTYFDNTIQRSPEHDYRRFQGDIMLKF